MMLPVAYETLSNNDVDPPLLPDLLRRFVELPHRASWYIDGVRLDVETNHRELLHSFPSHEELQAGASVRLKIVVDPDLSAGNDSESLILDSGQVCWAHVYGLLFVFDRASGESVIFLPGTDVKAFKSTFEQLLRRVEPILALP